MDLSIEILWKYFLIYAIAGWILESIFRSFCEKRLVNSGFLKGPVCPIYGAGAIIMLLFLRKFKDNLILLFVSSFIILSIWEYVVGIFLEKVFNTKYWDYSDQKFNIKGRVCLFNSTCWGILGVLFIHFIHPFVESILMKIDSIGVEIIFIVITIIFIIDTIVNVVKTKGMKATLDKVEQLNEQIKEKLEEIRKVDKKTHNKKTAEIKENLQKNIEQLKAKKNRMFRNLYRRVYRLKKAFPDIETKEITEILSNKWNNIQKRNSEVKKNIKTKNEKEKKENSDKK